MAAAPQIIRQVQEELDEERAKSLEPLAQWAIRIYPPSAFVHRDLKATNTLVPWSSLPSYTLVPLTKDAAFYPLALMETTRLEDDFHGWLVDQAKVLHAHRSDLLDWNALAEELESMAAGERREMRKQLKRLLAHLLKMKSQPDEVKRHHSWRTSIRDAREQIQDLLMESPGLFQGKRDEFLATTFERARIKASDETHLPLKDFPKDCPWSFEEIISDDFGLEPEARPAPDSSSN
ncbi:DUF29 domain-containing protein [Candidatus Binatus soli]|jgi:hypothetical protein|uniref:DUF29 domain-containing protein n=1 Tax=Candidatus Binatus soli TaxID=1953413 RepID=UPI003D126A6C